MKLFSKHSESYKANAARIEVIVDEENPFFKLADHNSAFRHITASSWPRSYDGFYKNGEKQRRAAAELSDLLGFTGKVLDVGFGSNIYISSELARQGLEAYAVDLNPQAFSQDVAVLRGNATTLGKKNRRLSNFNAIIYWGSWLGEGNAVFTSSRRTSQRIY
jgi:2-polyprenyl-3-methyl-5-hydroxy-6-metoxy-1,4-benzoquinol methylase